MLPGLWLALDDPADPCAGLNPPLEDRPIPDVYLIVEGGKLAGTGSQSYTTSGGDAGSPGSTGA